MSLQLVFCKDMISEIEGLITSNVSDNVICRSLKDSIDSLQKCISNYNDHILINGDTEDDQNDNNNDDVINGSETYPTSQSYNHDYNNEDAAGEDTNTNHPPYTHDNTEEAGFNLGNYGTSILNDMSVEEIIDSLSRPVRHGLRFLIRDLSLTRWKNIEEILVNLSKSDNITPRVRNFLIAYSHIIPFTFI